MPSLGNLIHFYAIKSDSDIHEIHMHIPSPDPLPKHQTHVFDILSKAFIGSNRLLKLDQNRAIFLLPATLLFPSSSCFIEGHHHLLGSEVKNLRSLP